MIINLGDRVHYTLVGVNMLRVATPENIDILRSLAAHGGVTAVDKF